MIYPSYSQRDPRWGTDLLGNSRGSTIAQYGCTMCCGAMAAGITPDLMNICLREHGGFQREPRGSWAATFDLSMCAPNLRLVYVSRKYEDVEAPLSLIDRTTAHVQRGNPAILQVDFSPAPKQQQHWVLITGAHVDEKGNVVYEINDPWPRADDPQPGTLCPRYGKTNAIAFIRVVLHIKEVSG